jgi:DNA polymerase III epsilon subunit-like protein
MGFETTGLGPRSARVTEVAALKIESGRVTDRFVTLINCGVAVPADITAFTGITTAMVRAAPPVAEVMPALSAHCGVRFASAAHRAEAGALVTGEVLTSLSGRILDAGVPAVTPRLLRELMACRIADAKSVMRREARGRE